MTINVIVAVSDNDPPYPTDEELQEEEAFLRSEDLREYEADRFRDMNDALLSALYKIKMKGQL